MTIIELTNPNPFHPLRIFSQDRLHNPYSAGLAPRPAKLDTRADFEALGARIINVPSRGTARDADGALKSVTREVPTPFYKTAGYESLAAFCTESMEKQLRDSQQTPRTVSPGQRVVDDWGVLKRTQLVQPGGKVVLNLEENTRTLIECVEEVALQIANQSNTRTLRLRTRDTETGETQHVAFIPPAREYPQAALVIANGSKSAVVELMPN